MGKPIIHFEVAGTDGPELESFYQRLFDWKIDHQGEGDMQYGFISDGSAGPIGGGIRHEPSGEAEVVFYVEVEDLAEVLAQQTDHPLRVSVVNTALVSALSGVQSEESSEE